MKKIALVSLAVAVVVGGGAFYGGMKYAEAKGGRRGGMPDGAARMQFGGGAGTPGARGGAMQNFASGEILSKDETSITIKLRDGGSRIVYFGESTSIMKSTKGAVEDLAVGAQVIVNGKANAEGSLTAETIQIPPEGATTQGFMGRGMGQGANDQPVPPTAQ